MKESTLTKKDQGETTNLMQSSLRGIIFNTGDEHKRLTDSTNKLGTSITT